MKNLTQLHQGSLNGLRRQTNECIDSAYRKGYEDCAKLYKQTAEEWDNELSQAKEDNYNQGLEDARNILLRLLEIPSSERAILFDNPDYYYTQIILEHYTINEIEDKINAYEEKKKSEEVENYHILVDTLRTVTEEYPKETIVSALSEFGFEVDKMRGEE